MITEGFNLPPEVESECNRLTEFIASMFLPYFKRRIEHSKTKSDFSIVKYNEYYRLALQYKNNKQYFDIKKSEIESNWGKTNFFIKSKNNILPRVWLKITSGYSTPADGNVTEIDPSVFILVDAYAFIHAFKNSTKILQETIEHEVKHYLQLTTDPDNTIGLPKFNVRDKNRDVFGYKKDSDSRYNRTSHVGRDIEFKPNVHTYADSIKQHLNRFYPKSKWKEGLKNLISNNDNFPKGSELNSDLENIDYLKKYDIERWKLFLKEIYKVIFEV